MSTASMLSHKGPLPSPQSLINSFTISSSLVRQTRLRVGNAQRRTLHFYEMRINEILKFWWREFSLVIERRLRKCRAWAQRRWSKYGTKSWNVCDEEEAFLFSKVEILPHRESFAHCFMTCLEMLVGGWRRKRLLIVFSLVAAIFWSWNW